MLKPDLIIPCQGKAEELAGPLRAIEPQRSHLGRVIVVDDGSDPPLSLPPWVECRRIERPQTYRGAGFARNFGSKLSDAEWLIFMDHTVYHHADAFFSMVRAAEFFSREESEILITLPCIFLPGDPDPDLEVELEKQKKEGRISGGHEDLNPERIFNEHTVAMIPHAYFNEMGGYDTDTFKHWGLEGTDLTVRVQAQGGVVCSTVPRVTTGKRLLCYHAWHDGDRDFELRQSEWLSKWGKNRWGFSKKTSDYLERISGEIHVDPS